MSRFPSIGHRVDPVPSFTTATRVFVSTLDDCLAGPRGEQHPGRLAACSVEHPGRLAPCSCLPNLRLARHQRCGGEGTLVRTVGVPQTWPDDRLTWGSFYWLETLGDMPRAQAEAGWWQGLASYWPRSYFNTDYQTTVAAFKYRNSIWCEPHRGVHYPAPALVSGDVFGVAGDTSSLCGSTARYYGSCIVHLAQIVNAELRVDWWAYTRTAGGSCYTLAGRQAEETDDVAVQVIRCEPITPEAFGPDRVVGRVFTLPDAHQCNAANSVVRPAATQTGCGEYLFPLLHVPQRAPGEPVIRGVDMRLRLQGTISRSSSVFLTVFGQRMQSIAQATPQWIAVLHGSPAEAPACGHREVDIVIDQEIPFWNADWGNNPLGWGGYGDEGIGPACIAVDIYDPPWQRTGGNSAVGEPWAAGWAGHTELEVVEFELRRFY